MYILKRVWSCFCATDFLSFLKSFVFLPVRDFRWSSASASVAKREPSHLTRNLTNASFVSLNQHCPCSTLSSSCLQNASSFGVQMIRLWSQRSLTKSKLQPGPSVYWVERETFYPNSTRDHEIGALRFSSFLTGIFSCLATALAALCWSGWEPRNSPVPGSCLQLHNWKIKRGCKQRNI